jgi:hypothetical protein
MAVKIYAKRVAMIGFALYIGTSMHGVSFY